jgi:hypothetical protein
MERLDYIQTRLECLRYAIEFGTVRDVVNPALLADKYYEWVMQGSDESRPVDNRKDDGLTAAKKPRSVRKGSASQMTTQPSGIGE